MTGDLTNAQFPMLNSHPKVDILAENKELYRIASPFG
jgi:hypothetical protein